ncbi:MAG: hypothetical protein L3K23_00540 [Thermoplasmata archaeon]|nr:hypothetical protein [Thermoplasmata archaeon]
MGLRPPPLYRASRAFWRLSTIALVLFVVFLGSAVYSAASLRPSSASAGPVSIASIGNDSFRVTALVNLTNPGFYPITDLKLEAHVREANGAELASGSSPWSDIPAGTTASILLRFQVDLATVPGARSLLTHDTSLPSYVRLQATYASVFKIVVDAPTNLSWGAPLAGLNITPAAPVAQPNGSVLDLVRVNFTNDARFDLTGSFDVRVLDAAGVACGAGSLAANVPAHAGFNRTMQVDLASGCNPQGGSVVAAFAGPSVYLVLPPEPLP